MLYFLKYQGFSDSYNAWIPACTCLDQNPENDKLRMRIFNEALLQNKEKSAAAKAKEKGKDKPSAQEANSNSTKNARNKKRTLDDDDTTIQDEFKIDSKENNKENTTRQTNIKLKIPGILKKQLLMDWENITKLQQVGPPHPTLSRSRVGFDFANRCLWNRLYHSVLRTSIFLLTFSHLLASLLYFVCSCYVSIPWNI